MARSHAKNNTSRAVMTYHERNLKSAGYGTQKARLGMDSMKKVDSCCLCLNRARNPVACPGKAHLFCKECVIADLLTQKSQIASHKASLDAYAAQEQQDLDRARSEARARVLADFERGITLGSSVSLLRPSTSTPSGSSTPTANPSSSTSTSTSKKDEDASRPLKRKFEFDQSAVERLAKEAEDAAMAAIEAEQQAKRRAKLPSFWLPTLTPDAKVGPLKDVKLHTVCSIGGVEGTHPLALKTLLPVIFNYPTHPTSSSNSSTTPTNPTCPSCAREITNAVKTYLLTSKAPASSSTTDEPSSKKSKGADGKAKGKEKEKEEHICGHVVCRTCVDAIVKPGKQCVVCEAKIRPEKDIVELAREGTGFAAAGGAEAKRANIAFG